MAWWRFTCSTSSLYLKGRIPREGLVVLIGFRAQQYLSRTCIIEHEGVIVYSRLLQKKAFWIDLKADVITQNVFPVLYEERTFPMCFSGNLAVNASPDEVFIWIGKHKKLKVGLELLYLKRKVVWEHF